MDVEITRDCFTSLALCDQIYRQESSERKSSYEADRAPSPRLNNIMHIYDLPIETFKLLLQHIALALGVESALRLRLVSRFFASEMIEALIESGVLDEVTDDVLALSTGPMGEELRVQRCPDESLKARYLYSRARREPSGFTEFIDHLRLIATEFVFKSGRRYDYDTALRTICGIVIQTSNLTVALTDNPLFHISEERHSAHQACLHMACGLGDLLLVSEFLDEGSVKVNPTDLQYFLSSPIRAAVRGNHRDVVDYLLQRNSRIEAANFENAEWTVIHDSVLNREPAMLAFLLDQKLEFPVRERHAGERLGSAYEDALITAAYQDNGVAFNMLLEKGPFKAPLPVPLQQLVLMAACEGRSLSIARATFDMNPSLDPNYDLREFVTRARSLGSVYSQRRCPLEAAAHWGSISLVELLLDHGADPNWSNGTGWSALYKAASHGYDRCGDMLLLAGADADDIASLEE